MLIGQSDILPRLFEHISIPSVVRDELAHDEAPLAVRKWIGRPPAWLEVVSVAETDDAENESLDAGERAALALAATLGAELVLMDDRSGVAAARRRGFAVTGTLGILDLAARRGFIRLDEAFARLRDTNFRCPENIMAALLSQHAGGRNG